jgi:hypothetical protein
MTFYYVSLTRLGARQEYDTAVAPIDLHSLYKVRKVNEK